MDAKEFRGESSKSWNNCNTTSSGARNAAPRRCGVARGASNGFEEVDQLDKKNLSRRGAEVLRRKIRRRGRLHSCEGAESDAPYSRQCFGSLGLWSRKPRQILATSPRLGRNRHAIPASYICCISSLFSETLRLIIIRYSGFCVFAMVPLGLWSI